MAPLPLERHDDFEHNGYDPRKVDVAYDLKEEEQRKCNINLAQKHVRFYIFSSLHMLSTTHYVCC